MRSRERRWTLPTFPSGVKARRGELTADSLQLTASVGYGIRDMPERTAASRKPIADSVETRMTADSLQLTTYGPGADEIRIVEDLLMARPPSILDRAFKGEL